MSNATLMVLGAGTYQVPLIRTAQRMGLKVVVTSIPGNYPGFAVADEALYLDTRDVDGICAAARERKVSAVLTTGTDVAVRTLGAVNDLLGTTGISGTAAQTLTDKALMKQAFAAGGVTTAAFRVVKTLDEAREAALDLGFPVMMKAVDVSGSRGISKVNDIPQLEEAFKKAAAVTQTDHFIVESVTEGTEIGLDAFVWNGTIQLAAAHAKLNHEVDGTTIPVGHVFPCPLESTTQQSLVRELAAVVAATEIDNSALNADLFVQPDGSISVIEVGGRAGGTCIPELMSLHFGVDYYEQMIRCAMGDKPDLVPRRHIPCVARLLWSEVPGTVVDIDYGRLSLLQSETTQVQFDCTIGDHIRAMRIGPDHIGQIVMATDTPTSIDSIAAQAMSCLTIEPAER